MGGHLKASRLALVLMAGIASFYAGPVFAQTADAKSQQTSSDKNTTDTKAPEEVVVVGSRIRRSTFNSTSPVQIITREETTLAGLNSTGEALQGVGVTGGNGQINNAFGGFVTNGGPGANTLSLRGLGATRTLILLNGRRIAPAGTRGAVGSADLNVLPDAIVDEIEILKDGASSIYGSDAVAGVVNIITDKKINGLTFESQGNFANHSSGNSYRASIVGGLTDERYTVSGSFEYRRQEEIKLGDRSWTKCNTDSRRDPVTGASTDLLDPKTGQPKCYPITATGSNGVTINTIGTSTIAGVPAVGAAANQVTFNRWRPNASVTTGLVGYEGVGGGNTGLNVRDTFDPAMLNNSLISPASNYNVFLQGSYDLRALGHAQAYMEFMYDRRDSEQTGYRQLSLDYPKNSPLIPTALRASTFSAAALAPGTYPVGVRAFIGWGNYLSSQKVDAYRGVVGVRGDFIIPEWKYDVAGIISRSNAQYAFGQFITDRLYDSLTVVTAPSNIDASLVRNGLTCAVNITNPGRGCIPAPALTADTVGGKLPDDWRKSIFRDVVGDTDFNEDTLAISIDGPMFSLPAGKVSSAFGFEYRSSSINDVPGIDMQTGNIYNFSTSTITKGSDAVKEAFGEVEVPLLKDITAAKNLTLNLSGRYTDYDSYGSQETYKFGGVYAPVEQVTIRSSYGTSYRAPALFEQFQGATSGFLSSAGDPCNGYGNAYAPGDIRYKNCDSELHNPNFQATNSIAVVTAGGAQQGLSAETSSSFTLGGIIKPDFGFIPGKLSMAADYFNIKVEYEVSRAGSGNILPLCYDAPGFRAAGSFCRLVTRNAASGALTVYDSYTNIATQISKGIDYNIRYEQEIGPGTFLLSGQITQYLSQANKTFKTDPLLELNGTLNNPKLTGVFSVKWTQDTWTYRYGVDWVQGTDSYAYLGLDPATSTYNFAVPDYFTHNASIRYKSPQKWEATIGVKNLTDAEPPIISSGNYNRVGNAPLYSGYDYFGRVFFLNVSKSF